jgi:hypothetical protein
MTADDAAEAHRAAVVAALLGVLGTTMGVIGFWRISGPALRILQAFGILLSGSVLLWLRAGQLSFTRRQSNALFLLVLAPTVVMTWLIDDARSNASAHWVPYEPSKLSALTLAIIAPPGWPIGLATILVFIGAALLHHAVLSDAIRARMSSGEPFGTIAYGAFALVLLWFRQRSYTMRGELERARAEKVSLERVARVAIALRDLANTPVQTLELVLQRLRTRAPDLELQTERMGRALERLRRLNDILGPYESAVVWDGEASTVDRELSIAKARLTAPLAAPARSALRRKRR